MISWITTVLSQMDIRLLKHIQFHYVFQFGLQFQEFTGMSMNVERFRVDFKTTVLFYK